MTDERTFTCKECDTAFEYKSVYCSRRCYDHHQADEGASNTSDPSHCTGCGERVLVGTLHSFCGEDCMSANKVRAKLRKLNHV